MCGDPPELGVFHVKPGTPRDSGACGTYRLCGPATFAVRAWQLLGIHDDLCQLLERPRLEVATRYISDHRFHGFWTNAKQ